MSVKEKLNELGVYLLEGMSEPEAAILSGISYQELQIAKENSDIVRDFIEKKQTEFIRNHLVEIQKNKSEKNSMWMLEKLFPDRFGARLRTGSGDNNTINIIGTIIKQIQNEDTGIVRIASRGNRDEQSDEDGSSGRIRVAEILG
jgi:hypothetical protein